MEIGGNRWTVDTLNLGITQPKLQVIVWPMRYKFLTRSEVVNT